MTEQEAARLLARWTQELRWDIQKANWRIQQLEHRVTQLENESLLTAAHRYWLDRYTPSQILDLATELEGVG